LPSFGLLSLSPLLPFSSASSIAKPHKHVPTVRLLRGLPLPPQTTRPPLLVAHRMVLFAAVLIYLLVAGRMGWQKQLDQ
jgi:hypothetical protein